MDVAHAHPPVPSPCPTCPPLQVTDDDDASDDDAQGNAGLAWAINTLPQAAVSPFPSASPDAVAAAADAIAAESGLGDRRQRRLHSQPLGVGVRGVVSMTAPAFALRLDGRVLVPLSDGSLAIVGPERAPPPGVSDKVIIAVTSAVVLVVLLAVGLVTWFGCRHRMRRAAAGGVAATASGEGTVATSTGWHVLDGGEHHDAVLVAHEDGLHGDSHHYGEVMESGDESTAAGVYVTYAPPTAHSLNGGVL